MIRALLFFISFSTLSIHAQDRIEISLDSSELAGNYEIETLRFYLTNFKYKETIGTILREENSAYLIDIEQPESWTILLPKNFFSTKIDSISFLIGTDSLTNVSGILDGDLDPINGMYWAWNSGYINFKVEGTKLDSNTHFEYHLGGYLPPNATSQKCSFPMVDLEVLHIRLNLAQFLDQINMEQLNEVMIPGANAVQLSNQLSSCFSIE